MCGGSWPRPASATVPAATAATRASVLAGSVRFEVGGAGHELGPGDILWVPADVLRGFEAGPAGAELLAVHLPRRCLS